jgi:hypothetical protein
MLAEDAIKRAIGDFKKKKEGQNGENKAEESKQE